MDFVSFNQVISLSFYFIIKMQNDKSIIYGKKTLTSKLWYTRKSKLLNIKFIKKIVFNFILNRYNHLL